MRLRQVAQRVVDLDRAVAFYRDVLECELVARFDPPGMAFLRLGETRLLLEAEAPRALLYLEVDDIERHWGVLQEAGVTCEQAPQAVFRDDEGLFGPAGEEEWMAFFRDSEGNLIALASRRRPL